MSVTARAGYSATQILLHWAIAALVFFQLVFGESMSEVIEAAEEGETPEALDQTLASLHYWVGIAVLALVALRIVLRLTRGVPAPEGAPSLQSKLASAVHGLFYALLVLVPVSGLLGFYLGDPWGELHAFAKPVFIVLIAAHVLGALAHHFVAKDGTLRRMFVPVNG